MCLNKQYHLCLQPDTNSGRHHRFTGLLCERTDNTSREIKRERDRGEGSGHKLGKIQIQGEENAERQRQKESETDRNTVIKRVVDECKSPIIWNLSLTSED